MSFIYCGEEKFVDNFVTLEKKILKCQVIHKFSYLKYEFFSTLIKLISRAVFPTLLLQPSKLLWPRRKLWISFVHRSIYLKLRHLHWYLKSLLNQCSLKRWCNRFQWPLRLLSLRLLQCLSYLSQLSLKLRPRLLLKWVVSLNSWETRRHGRGWFTKSSFPISFWKFKFTRV